MHRPGTSITRALSSPQLCLPAPSIVHPLYKVHYILFIPFGYTLSILLFSTFVLLNFTFILHVQFCLAFVFFYFFPLQPSLPPASFHTFLHSLSFLFLLSLSLMGFLLNFCSVSFLTHSIPTKPVVVIYFTMYISHFDSLSLSPTLSVFFSAYSYIPVFYKRDSCMRWFSRFSIIFSK